MPAMPDFPEVLVTRLPSCDVVHLPCDGGYLVIRRRPNRPMAPLRASPPCAAPWTPEHELFHLWLRARLCQWALTRVARMADRSDAAAAAACSSETDDESAPLPPPPPAKRSRRSAACRTGACLADSRGGRGPGRPGTVAHVGELTCGGCRLHPLCCRRMRIAALPARHNHPSAMQ